MIDRKVSIRYARALLGVCADKGLDEDEILKMLKELDAFFGENPQVLEYLSTYVVSTDNKKKVIEQLVNNEMLADFLNYVIRKGRFALFSQIVEIFEELVDEKKGRVKAIVKSAVELDSEEKNKLKEQLSKKLNKDVEFEFFVDGDLIAGIIVQVKDVVYDGSVKTYLSNLEQRLLRLSV
ncbi:ATP synthase F1 subunit delta [Hippea maritima]|uniref:ATP synthase subunit delta n=1 Tax=Hippea maritima (strain ATCC 700847 / DSM 10411 / MH2) TaxID=760142 RepID=F2LW29_HIPMA|nr:ATP synthase F1 subunit delta [Hippea maritima]AEA33963.1 ATP synthase subunit delta [Hippea maritima DSM 10411]